MLKLQGLKQKTSYVVEVSAENGVGPSDAGRINATTKDRGLWKWVGEMVGFVVVVEGGFIGRGADGSRQGLMVVKSGEWWLVVDGGGWW